MIFRPYTLEELQNMLTVEAIRNAINTNRIIIDVDAENPTAHFRHSLDIDGENSYMFLSQEYGDIRQMDDNEIAHLVADTLLTLVEDDPDSYADEISFYADIIAGNASR